MHNGNQLQAQVLQEQLQAPEWCLPSSMHRTLRGSKLTRIAEPVLQLQGMPA